MTDPVLSRVVTPIVANDRDRRALAWLTDQFGADAITAAITRLPHHRRPYLTNIAAVLGVELPRTLGVPAADSPIRVTVRAKVEALRRGMAPTGRHR
jgi:hypothetical protein